MKNLLIRTLTGTVFVSVILTCLWLGQYSYWILFLVLMIGGMYEFFQFFSRSPVNPVRMASIFGAIVVFLFTTLISKGLLDHHFIFILIPLFIWICLAELYRFSEKPLENIAVSLLSILYIAVPLSLTSMLVFPDTETYSPNLLISLFVIIWIYDSSAYLFGSTFGKHRLFERISPKKSWEGAIGGALLTLLATYFLADYAPDINRLHWMIITLLVVVFSTFGDLTESLFKRQFELKDSSNFFPGHGGILDRFDSLLFAAPVVVFYIKIIL